MPVQRALGPALAALWASLLRLRSWNPQQGWQVPAAAANPYPSFCLLAGLGLNRLVVPERFGLHLLDFIEGGSIPGDLFDDGDEMDLCPIMPGQINSDSHGLVCTWGTIVRH